MARASTHTLLALDRYAKIMGITPPHFNTAAGNDDPAIFPVIGECSDVWWQYAWQNSDQVSREDLASAIADAEQDIANVLGYWPGPVWISNEVHQYPRPYRRDTYGLGYNVRLQYKSLKTKYGKIIYAGPRATAVVANDVVIVYSDPDGDGYNELATVSTVTTLTDACEIRCYFDGEGGNQEWEIRPPKSVTLSGGTITFTFDAWQLIDPDLWEAFQTSNGLRVIDLEDAANYVATVDVWREYTDTADTSATFYWERQPTTFLTGISGLCNSCGGSGCEACTLITQDGCIHIRDVDTGLVVPTPATYSDGAWSSDCWTECREPDQVKIWYYAGQLSERFLRGSTCDPLDDQLARTIAMLATARLERQLCGCNNQQALSQDWQRDLAFTPPEGGSFLLSEDDLNNPFGTKQGEVLAWKRLSRLVENVPRGVALV